MKKYLIIISVIAMLLCFTSAMAAPVDTYEVESATSTLVITGSIDGFAEGNQYRIVVFGKDKAFDADAKYNDAKIAEDIIFMSQIAVDENGGYTARVGMADRESGFYVVRINGSDAIKFYYATKTDKSMYLRDVRSICTSGDEDAVTKLVTLLDLNDGDSTLINYFMIADKYVTTVNSETLADILRDAIKEDPLLASSEDKFVAAVTKAAHIAALNEDEIQISELFSEINLDADYIKVYNEKLTDKAKNSVVTDSYKGKGYNAKEAEAAFNEAVAYAYINNLSTWADAKHFVEELGKDFGIDVAKFNKLSTSAKSDLYDYMTDKAPKTSVKAFADAVDDEIDELKSSSGASSGGGGGGGGFSSGPTGGYVPVAPEVEVEYFSDMAGYEWAKESVDTLYEKGIVSGVGDGKFAPDKAVTREEMLAMLIRAYGVSTEGVPNASFADVPESSWFAPYVAAGYAKGYVNGISATEFGAGANVTRQDASVMAYNIATAFGKNFTEAAAEFTDNAEISEYAKKAVYALKGTGVINGKGEGTFAPKDSCTRAEAAIIIYNLIK